MSEALPAGTRLDNRYVIEGVLGRGAFAFTYMARDERMDETVAIKELFPDGCQRSGLQVSPTSQEAVELLSRSLRWFREEAEILQGFRDRRIVEVRDTFDANGTTYVVLGYIDGKNLEQEAKDARGKLTPVEVTRVLRQILLALEVVHTEALHRDLKPSNVMRTPDGRIVLIDFGAAREHKVAASQTVSTMMFTLDYAAPEQLRPGSEKTAATDLYAVGGIGFRLLMGRPLPRWEGKDMLGDLAAIGDPKLVATVGWALQREPRARPRSAAEMLAALEGIKRPGRGIFDKPRRRIPRPGPPPIEPDMHRTDGSRRPSPWRRSKETSSEARRLASGAHWPLAMLAGTPGLALPLMTGAFYVAAVVAVAALVGMRGALRDALGPKRVTAATILFVGPRLLTRLIGRSILAIVLAGLASVLVALMVALGAGVAAGYAVAHTVALGQHLTHESFMTGFRQAFPRTAVTVPVVLLLASRMNGENGIVERTALRAAKLTEASVALLWVLGVGIPLLVILQFPCRTWAPFSNYDQALIWAESQVPPVVYIDNAIAEGEIDKQIQRGVACGAMATHNGVLLDQVGKRSFLATLDVDHHAMEQFAAHASTAGSSNVVRQVTIAAVLLSRLDGVLSKRVREITLNEGDVTTSPSGHVSMSNQVLALVLPRPNGSVMHGIRDPARILGMVRRIEADGPFSDAAHQLLASGQGPSTEALCG